LRLLRREARALPAEAPILLLLRNNLQGWCVGRGTDGSSLPCFVVSPSAASRGTPLSLSCPSVSVCVCVGVCV
jgi:hypothetical protein